MNQDQEELVVICYFVGPHTRRLAEARFVLINQNCSFFFDVLIPFFPSSKPLFVRIWLVETG